MHPTREDRNYCWSALHTVRPRHAHCVMMAPPDDVGLQVIIKAYIIRVNKQMALVKSIFSARYICSSVPYLLQQAQLPFESLD